MSISGQGYLISVNANNMFTVYSKLQLVGSITKSSSYATSKFGVCIYTGDSQGVGCAYGHYDTTLGPYSSGTVTNPYVTTFNNPATMVYDDGDHVAFLVADGGTATVKRIFAIRQ